MEKSKDIKQREMARKSQDRLRVLNPLDEDYNVKWDGYLHRVSSRGEAILPRYIANKYIREMTDKILMEKQDRYIIEENEKRIKSGQEPMAKYQGGEQPTKEGLYAKTKGLANPGARKAVMRTLYGGLVEEYGLEVRSEMPQKTSTRPMDDLLLEEIQSENVAPIEKIVNGDLTDKSVFELQKIAREKGVDFDKTAKKNELINKISQ